MRMLWQLLLVLGLVTPELVADPYGTFKGTVRAEWRDDGRTMRLLEPFSYVDPDGTEWLAPADSTIDGASIPRSLWSLIGGPYEGKYRRASVVHDVACEVRRRPWRTTHRMFYLACRAGGLDSLDAKVMYGAVTLFGPRWPTPQALTLHAAPAKTTAPAEAYAAPLSSEDDFLRMREWIETHPELTLEDIERLDRPTLTQSVPKLPAARRGLLEP